MTSGQENNQFSTQPDSINRTLSGQPRIAQLTGLRWVAAFMVFFSHFPPPIVLFETGPLSAFVANGSSGVTIFFVLSGFILTVTYFDTLLESGLTSMKKYAVARIARIYPLYLFVLGVIFVAARGQGAPTSRGLLLQHVLAIQTWSPDAVEAFYYNAPAWSVGVEFFLYACFPFLLLVFHKLLKTLRGSVTVAVIAFLFSLAVFVIVQVFGFTNLPTFDPNSAHRWIYRFPVARLGDFILGMGAAGIFFTQKLHSKPRFWNLLTLLALIMFLALMASENLVNTAQSWDLLFILPTGTLILALALSPTGVFSKLLSTPLAVTLGEISFAFYLIHVPVGNILMESVDFPKDSVWSVTWWFIVILIIVACSLGLHLLVERPSRILIRKLLSN